MKKETRLLLEKSERSLAAAKALFERGDYDFAASRAYYAMFYAAEAALLEKGKTYSKHAGVVAGFYECFVATGQLPKTLHQTLHAAFDDRQQGDYAFLDPFPKEEAMILLKNAGVFLEEIKKILTKSATSGR